MCKGKHRWPLSYDLEDDRCHMGHNPSPSEVKGSLLLHENLSYSVVGFGFAFVHAP